MDPLLLLARINLHHNDPLYLGGATTIDRHHMPRISAEHNSYNRICPTKLLHKTIFQRLKLRSSVERNPMIDTTKIGSVSSSSSRILYGGSRPCASGEIQ